MPPVHHRYGVLLALILTTIAFQLGASDGDWAQLIAVVLQAATLVMAVVTSESRVWFIRFTVAAVLLLTAGAVFALFGTEDLGQDSARLIALLLVALAPAAIVAGLYRHFLTERRITRETMFGVLCIYLLIGMFFGGAFAALETISGQDFFTAGAGNTSDFLYFSFSTITTTGYGDLVAATDAGRSLAITEALLGQIYLVTVVALIVGNVGSVAPLSRD